MTSPLFSIVTPVYRPRADHLQLTIDSVLAQTDDNWEWILVDDASRDAAVSEVLHRAARLDPRIQIVERAENGHIVAASNDGLALARGEWIVLMDHDDLLVDIALERLHAAIDAHPNAGYVYTDEDKIDDDGTLSGRFCKPEWSPERLRHQMYLGHLSALRADLVSAVGGFHPGFDGSQDHDLALRVTEQCAEVVHVPEVLYHWRMVPGSTAGDASAKDYATEAGLRAVAAHLERMGLSSTMTVNAHPMIAHTYDIHRTIDPGVLISVIIPTRGTEGLVWGTRRSLVVGVVRSLLEHTDHSNLEIVLVYDPDTPQAALDELRALCGGRLMEVRYTAPFNFSDKCNRGFLAASGEIVVFLNDDMEIISDRFIEELCGPLIEEDVAATGARLTYSDSSIQHAGLVFQTDQYLHAYLGTSKDDPGYFAELCTDHEVSGLTGAAIALRHHVFAEVGGFATELPSNFNDVDLALKLRSTGRRLVWLHDVCAVHFESQSREPTVRAWEHQFILSRWGDQGDDPYMPFEAASELARIESLSRLN